MIRKNNMPKVKNVEKKIWDVEGFDVAFCQNGKNVHGAKQGVPQYPYSNKVKNNQTVNDWKKNRFAENYPGFDVIVYDGDGKEVKGQTKISTVRDSYNEDE